MTRGRIFLCAVAVAVAAGLVGAWLEPAKEKAEVPPSRVSELLKTVVVPRVDLRGIGIEQVVEALNQYAATEELFQKDPPFVLWKRGDPIPSGMALLPTASKKAREISGAEASGPEHETAVRKDTEVTMIFTDTPLTEVARDLTSPLGFSHSEVGEHILVYPSDVLNPDPVTREFYLLWPGYVESVLLIPKGSPSGRIDVRAGLAANGVQFPPGSFAYYEPGDMRLVVGIAASHKDAAEQMDLIDCIFSLGPTEGAAPSRWERTKIQASNYWYEFSSHFRWNSHP